MKVQSDKLPQWLTPVNLGWLALLLCLAGLSTSKALQSISFAMLGAAGLWQIVLHKGLKTLREPRYIILLALPLVLSILAYFYTDTALWARDVRAKILFLVLPLGLYLLPPFSRWQYRFLFAVFVPVQTIVASASVAGYLMNFEEVQADIRHNSNIDIIGNMSHIYFGLLLALSIIICFFLVFDTKKYLWKGERTYFLILGLINLIFLHILTSRTGLVSFYLACLFLAFVISYRKKALHWLLVVIGGGFLILFLSYQYIPSFRQRANVTHWDLDMYVKQESQFFSQSSLSMRLIAWQVGWKIFASHPLTGVGIANLETAMKQGYISDFPEIAEDRTLANAHNQYLEYMIGFGVGGLLVLLLLLVYPFTQSHWKMSLLSLTFLLMLSCGMVFEAFLERQVGICTFLLFVLVLPDFQLLETKMNE